MAAEGILKIFFTPESVEITGKNGISRILVHIQNNSGAFWTFLTDFGYKGIFLRQVFIGADYGRLTFARAESIAAENMADTALTRFFVIFGDAAFLHPLSHRRGNSGGKLRLNKAGVNLHNIVSALTVKAGYGFIVFA